jgi:hypothetical protein
MLAMTTSPQEKHLRSALQVCFLFIADMGRLQLKYTLLAGAGATASDHELRAETEAQVEAFRHKALSIATHDGSPFEGLSKLASTVALDGSGQSHRKKDTFLCAYYLARGMAVEVCAPPILLQ